MDGGANISFTGVSSGVIISFTDRQMLHAQWHYLRLFHFTYLFVSPSFLFTPFSRTQRRRALDN
jgi:hypothetical protein